MKSRKAFTLIELLIVITIIAIMISLLMPAINGVIETANMAACTSNLHQMGVLGYAFHAYREYLPSEYFIDGWFIQYQNGHGGRRWPDQLRLYGDSDPGIFLCPSAPPWMEWDGKTLTWSAAFSYGLNTLGTNVGVYFGYSEELDKMRGWWNTWQHWFEHGLMDGRSLSQIVSSSNFYWIADSNDGSVEDPLGNYFYFRVGVEGAYWDYRGMQTQWEWPGARHFGGCNVLFADAHVEWIRRGVEWDPYLEQVIVPDLDDTGAMFGAVYLNIAKYPKARADWRRKLNRDNQPHEEDPPS